MSGFGGGRPSQAVGPIADELLFRADMLMEPDSSWPVAAGAPSIPDVSGVTPIVRVLLDTAETGVGFSVYIPKQAAAVHIRLMARAQVAPAPERSKTVVRLHAWNGQVWEGPAALGYVLFPASQELVNAEFAVNLRAMKVRPERFTIFELTRNPTTTDLRGAVLLHGVGVSFVTG